RKISSSYTTNPSCCGPRPATEFIIDNPSIADVSVRSGKPVVVTGKSFGITNILALELHQQRCRHRPKRQRLWWHHSGELHQQRRGVQRQRRRIGSTSSVVFVTVCYPWDFGGKLPMLKMGNLVIGAFLMQASAAFRAAPYN
ncbi:MAG TPA: pilus assembly protein N-terminal domain-containing protein, partial [Hyphomicrobiaceae bacterium]|nr:pilus assembly protein N-terminal domain-containing protein [Hyphomicrobiaceae bacterium]